MRTFTLFVFGLLAILLIAGIVLAYIYGHIPIPHQHGNDIRNCYGYAQARAFGKAPGDPECDPNTTFAEKIYTGYFPFVNKPNLSGIYVGCIVVFGERRVHPEGHAAYVVEVPSPLIINNIKVDHIPWQGAGPRTGVKLSDVIAVQVNPAGYHTGGTLPTATLTFKNSFEAGLLRVGKNKFGNWIEVPHNTSKSYFIGSSLDIMAIDNQEYPTGYKQRYQYWQKDGENKGSQNPRTINIDGDATYEAVFLTEFNITFQNKFMSVSGYPGIIKVNGSTKNSPHIEKVLQYKSVTGEAIWQVYNHIEYTFSQWSDGYSSASRTITPTDHGSYTANFTGKPRQMTYYGLHTNTTPGDYVTLYWNEHPNPNVTKYQIWRKVKHSKTGQTEGPYLLTTLNRGTTCWTDSEYILTDG